MPLKILYNCNHCNKRMPDDYKSMLCACGGQFTTEFARYSGYCSHFEPHFCETIKQYVTSWKDQERKAKAYRNVDHPEGFTLLQANSSYMKHLKKVHKNGEDIKAQQYAKDGIKYPKGKPVKWDEASGQFVNKKTLQPITTKRTSVPTKPLRVSNKLTKSVSLVIGFLLCASCSFASIDGVPEVPLTVNGITYRVPLHRPEFTAEKARIVLDMLDGDKNARIVFLGGEKKKAIFIGDGEKIRWLWITADSEWVTE